MAKRILSAMCFTLLGALLTVAVLYLWVMTYPEAGDPKNIEYVLWTHGLNQNMNLDHTVATMTHDVWPNRLVLGLSTEQLKSRFGVVRTLKEARPYDQECYALSRTDGKDVLFLRDSDWMVLMENGRAVDLILCKGF